MATKKKTTKASAKPAKKTAKKKTDRGISVLDAAAKVRAGASMSGSTSRSPLPGPASMRCS